MPTKACRQDRARSEAAVMALRVTGRALGSYRPYGDDIAAAAIEAALRPGKRG
jgi:hypothetical protein